VALWLTGQSVNLMTLGGLALAVGILVDEATVEIENIHVQMTQTDSVPLAVLRGNKLTAVPRLLAMLSILAVFMPSFFMEATARALFVPLALAVGFSMITSYLLSSTLVPVLAVWLLRHHGGNTHHEHTQERNARKNSPFLSFVFSRFGDWLSFARFRTVYIRCLRQLLTHRRGLVVGYLVVTGLIIWLGGRQLGTEIFPVVDSGQFQLRVRGPTGTRIERTEEIAKDTLDILKEEVGQDNLEITVAFGGVSPSTYTINTVYLWTGGPEEVVLRVALKHDSGIRVEELKEHLRQVLPERLRQRLAVRLRKEGLPETAIAQRLADLRLSFEPADVVNEVMSFGSPTPVEVVLYGPTLADTRAYAAKVRQQLESIPTLRDLQVVQAFNYPTAQIDLDRQLAGASGVTAEDLTRAAVPFTSSTRFTVPNFWVDGKSGTGYQVQVEVPQTRMDSLKEIGMITVKPTSKGQVMLRDVATVTEGLMPSEVDRYNMRRMVTFTANIAGEDLGRTAGRIREALRGAGPPPRGVILDVRGQVAPMEQMFKGLALGLLLSVVVIFLLLSANFQSFRMALTVASAVPAVLAGVILMLLATGTTLNIQSFMGAIMSIGVAVANGILLLSFAERRRHTGASALEAAIEGGEGRLRPILMTSFAMLAGMIPMALALGEGGEQTAPLGRAVIGGLMAATMATLTVLPAVFALVQNRASTTSASLHPMDPASPYYVATAGQPISGGEDDGLEQGITT
jgi:multidrug efflux pump subunit AcrB